MASQKPAVIYSEAILTGGGLADTVQTLKAGDYVDLTSLGTGTASSSTFLRGDGTWSAAPVTSVNSYTGPVTLTHTDVGAAASSHTHAASDITSGVLATARLASTGTASSATFLRGDQSWSAAPVVSVNTQTGAVVLTNTDVGAAATVHTHAASAITSGTIDTARLGSGTASASTYLRGDQTWATVSASGGMNVDIQTFTSSGTWTKPAGAKHCLIYMQGGGDGGGSGRVSASGVAASGGVGGYTGNMEAFIINGDVLPASFTVTVGSGGSGGAAVSTGTTNGNAGSLGGATTLVDPSTSTQWFGTRIGSTVGPPGGTSGTTSPASKLYHGSIFGKKLLGATASSSDVCIPPSTSVTSIQPQVPTQTSANTLSHSASNGGGISTANAPSDGGNIGAIQLSTGSNTTSVVLGGTSSTTGNAGAGGNGLLVNSAVRFLSIWPNGHTLGGAGGGASTAGNGGAGGNGAANSGGGGGGGGAARDGFSSGAGGNGGSGWCQIVTYY